MRINQSRIEDSDDLKWFKRINKLIQFKIFPCNECETITFAEDTAIFVSECHLVTLASYFAQYSGRSKLMRQRPRENIQVPMVASTRPSIRNSLLIVTRPSPSLSKNRT
jgi:hypothetical protein